MIQFSFEKRLVELKDYLEGKTTWIDIRPQYKNAQDEYNTVKTLI